MVRFYFFKTMVSLFTCVILLSGCAEVFRYSKSLTYPRHLLIPPGAVLPSHERDCPSGVSLCPDDLVIVAQGFMIPEINMDTDIDDLSVGRDLLYDVRDIEGDREILLGSETLEKYGGEACATRNAPLGKIVVTTHKLEKKDQQNVQHYSEQLDRKHYTYYVPPKGPCSEASEVQAVFDYQQDKARVLSLGNIQ